MNDHTIESILTPLRQPFIILPNGSSQTDLKNHGRVGFFIERHFGINPNCSREPDINGIEIKTIHVGRKATIGTMPSSEYNRIINNSNHYFGKSDPYKKMKNTLLISYEKLKDQPVPEYVMRDWKLFSLNALPRSIRKTLQEDYAFICDLIKKNSDSRDDLTKNLMDGGCYSGDYLSLNYKGNGGCFGYYYPAWSFKASFFRDI